MPALTDTEIATYRTGGPLAIRYYLAVEPRDVAMKASLNNADATFGDRTIPYDNITVGSDLYVREGHTLELWNAAETVYRGKIRIRSIDTSADEITVAANDDLRWTNNDILIVRDTYEPWSRPTNMVDTGVGGGIIYYKDWDIAYTDNNTSFPPKANGGVEFAGYLGSGGYVDVVLPGADLSLPIAPGANIASYSWDIGDGSFQVGDATTGNIIARFTNARFRWVHLTVTDSNGKTGIHHIPIWTFGAGYDPLKDFNIRRRMYGVEEAELVVECFDTADLTEGDIADGALVALFSEEYIGSTLNTSDCGALFTGRRQVRFCGWILRDTVRWNPETGTVSFSVGNIGKKVKELLGYGTFVADVDTTPTNWHEATNLTARMIIHFILHWQTTIPTICCIEYFDFNATDSTPLIAGRKFGVSSPFKQIQEAMLMGRGLFMYCGTSRWSSVHFRYDPQGLSDSDRTTILTVADMENTDLFTEMSFERASQPRVSSVIGGGIVYNGSDGLPLRARAPGRVGRHASQRDRVENLIISNQTHLNTLLGRYLGKASDPWNEVPLEAMWDVFEPALQEYVTLDVPASSNPRGWAFDTTQKWIVRRADVQDTPLGAPEVRLEVERLAEPTNSVAVAIPAVPNFPWPDYPAPLTLPSPEEPAVLGERLLVATDYGMYMTADLSSSFPTWESVGTALIGKVIYDFAFSDVNNRQLIAIEADAGYGSTSFGNVWMISDYRTGEWVKVIDGTTEDTDLTSVEGAAVSGGFVQAHGFEGHAVVIANYTSGTAPNKTRTYTFLNWSTGYTRSAKWSNPSDPWGASSRELFNIGIDTGAVLNVNGTLHACLQQGLIGQHDVRMTSTDFGQTWTVQEEGPSKPSAFSIRGGLHIEGDHIIWVTYDSAETYGYTLQRWVGGARSGRVTLEDWQTTDINGIHMGYRRHVMYGADVSFLYLDTYDSLNPAVDGRYGWTYVYKDSGWPSNWESVDIPIYARSSDSFWGDPENMIAMGNNHKYVGAVGEYLVMLLGGDGTVLANKSGTGGTGLYGLGATNVNRILFDQWED